MSGYAVRGLDDVEAVPWPGGLTWHPVRMELGARAFGVGGFSADRAGAVVVEPHTEEGERARPLIEREPERAREILEVGLRELPESAAVRYGFALLHAAQGRREESAAALREAIAREPALRDEARGEPLLAGLEP